MTDMVNHPPHYTGHKIFSRECIEYTRFLNFTSGNAFKYLYRQGQKFNTQEDIDKAIWYIHDEFKHENPTMSIPDYMIIEMQEELGNYTKQQGINMNGRSIEDNDVLIGSIMIEIASSSFFDVSRRETSQRLVNKLS